MQQIQLAQKSGVDAQTINKMVRGWSFGKSVKTISKHLQPVLTTLIAERALISPKQVQDFLEKSPLKNVSEGGAKIDELLDIAKEALKRREELEKPNYYTLHQLPLIGRNEDIEIIYNKLLEPQKRFLTLIGVPGIGKTELARQIEELAKKKNDFAYVSPLIPLENVMSSDEVLRIISDNLAGIDTQLLTLLILDNCEQIEDIEKARSEIYKLLGKYKRLTILATSCIEFSEERHKVLPLDVPFSLIDIENMTLDQLREVYSGIELFLEHANIADISVLSTQDVEDIAEICMVLDGLPLALRIAASWVEQLHIGGVYNEVIEKSLQTTRNKFPDTTKHLSLMEVITQSYESLDKSEQILFRRLGIFGEPFSVRGVEAICNLGDLPSSLLHSLQILCTHNLVDLTEYGGMIGVEIAHNTLREFALFKLYEMEEAEKLVERFIERQYSNECRRVIDEYNKDKEDIMQGFIGMEPDDFVEAEDDDDYYPHYFDDASWEGEEHKEELKFEENWEHYDIEYYLEIILRSIRKNEEEEKRRWLDLWKDIDIYKIPYRLWRWWNSYWDIGIPAYIVESPTIHRYPKWLRAKGVELKVKFVEVKKEKRLRIVKSLLLYNKREVNLNLSPPPYPALKDVL